MYRTQGNLMTLYKISNLCMILEEYCKLYKNNELSEIILPMIEHINYDISLLLQDNDTRS